MPSMAVLAWMRLARVYQKVNRDTVVLLRQFGLTLAQFDVLARVGAAEGITQQELADRLLVTKGNISQLLDRLERRGLLKRCQEGRTNTLSLTEEGQQVYAQGVPAQEERVGQQFAALTCQEVNQ